MVKISFMRSIALMGVVFAAVLLTGCGEDPAKQAELETRTSVENQLTNTTQNIASLSTKLANRELSNAKMVFLYADVVQKDSHDLSAIVEQLKLDATNKGSLFVSLKNRLQNVEANFGSVIGSMNKSSNEDRYRVALLQYNKVIIPELASLNGAANSDSYNDALSDVVNTLAEMSKGKLARVDGKKPDEFYKESGAQNGGPGTLLVGNDNYGSWKQDSNGNSFWEFYGQYAMMSALIGGNSHPVYYNNWSAHRPYSAYNDGYGARYSNTYRQNNSRLSSRYHVSSSSAAQRYIKKNPRLLNAYEKTTRYQVKNKQKSQGSYSSGSNSSVNTTKASSSTTKYSSMYSAPKPKSSFSSYSSTKPKSSSTSYSTTKPKSSYSSYKAVKSFSRSSFSSKRR